MTAAEYLLAGQTQEAATWQAVEIFEERNGSPANSYTIVDIGDHNQVALGEGSLPVAVKVPRRGREGEDNITLESIVLDDCEYVAEQSPPPLCMPKVIDLYEGPSIHYLAVSRLAGESLSLAAFQALHPEKQTVAGRHIGEFAAWLSRVHTLDEYPAMVRDAGRPYVLFDRGRDVATVIRRAYPGMLRQFGYVALAEAFDWLQEKSDIGDCRRQPPSIVGHDDLAVRNVLFDNGEPVSVVDFSMAQPTTPERELRHIWAVGGVAAQAAAEAYQEATGSVLSKVALRYWALAQSATNLAYFVVRPDVLVDPPYIRALGHDLSQLMPREDWDEEISAFLRRLPESRLVAGTAS